MEPHPTPFPVKSQHMKPKSTRKTSEDPKINTKGGPLLREKRVFGTSRNPNIPSRTAPEKPAKAKPLSGQLPKAAKPSQVTRSPIAEAKKSSEKNPERPRKKSVCFQENKVEKNGKFSRDGNVVEPQTPVKSPAVLAKPRLSGTPYRSAERCSKCRFDRLETSAYWLGQIKMAESVEKHFVSAAFFQLAFDCKAEPISNIRVELKKYLKRHEHLNGEEDWKRLSVSSGLVAEESSVDEGNIKGEAEEEKARIGNQEDEENKT